MFEVKTLTEVDILVVGGGAAGCLAATAAARKGKKALLIEAMGALGGSRTWMGVDSFNGFYSPGKTIYQLVGGISFEVAERLLTQGGAFLRQNTFGSGPVVTYEIEKLKILYEDMVIQAGGQLLFYTSAVDVEYNDGKIDSVIICNKSGLSRVRAKIVIDASGDLDIGAKAGEDFELAGENDSPVQSLTTVFYMANVNNEKAFSLSQGERTRIMQQAHESGKYRLTRIGGSIHPTPNPGFVHANLTRIPNVNAVDPFALTAAEIEGRKQVQEYVRFLINEYPGFENAYLAATACSIGVRETRRLKGQYILNGNDVREGMKFEDAVACCSAPIEDHVAGKNVEWQYLEAGNYYQIPYRSLLPVKTKNLIVAGRCLSATHDGQASARNSAQCMAMGEAAGMAAALCNETGVFPTELDRKLLAKELVNQGVLLAPLEVNLKGLLQ
ncbi:MAG: FAD-dependent oxidoreductase [Anaerolineaceae bacterium]